MNRKPKGMDGLYKQVCMRYSGLLFTHTQGRQQRGGAGVAILCHDVGYYVVRVLLPPPLGPIQSFLTGRASLVSIRIEKIEGGLSQVFKDGLSC